jgi:hypothetical protein
MTESSTPYYTSDLCFECQANVRGLHGRYTCGACGYNSPYLPPPEGWQTDGDVGADPEPAERLT